MFLKIFLCDNLIFSPALGSTTMVTSRLCSALLDDIIRVTVDRKKVKMPKTRI